MDDLYGNALDQVSPEFREFVTTYEELVTLGDHAQLDTFVNDLCRTFKGSNIERLVVESIILRRDAVIVRDRLTKDVLCTAVFDACLNFHDQAKELGLSRLADLFSTLAFTVVVSHAKCIAIVHGYKLPLTDVEVAVAEVASMYAPTACNKVEG